MKLGKQPTIVKDHCLLNGRGASKDTSTAERLTRGKMLGLGMRESKRKTLPTAVFPTEVEGSRNRPASSSWAFFAGAKSLVTCR